MACQLYAGRGRKVFEICDPLERKLALWLAGCCQSARDAVFGNPPATLWNKRSYVGLSPGQPAARSVFLCRVKGGEARRGLSLDDAAASDHVASAGAHFSLHGLLSEETAIPPVTSSQPAERTSNSIHSSGLKSPPPPPLKASNQVSHPYRAKGKIMLKLVCFFSGKKERGYGSITI